MKNNDDKPAPAAPNPSAYHHGGTATLPYPGSRLAPSYSLVDMAMEISRAGQQVEQRTHAKLEVIAAQIRHLQQQAHTILAQAQQDQMLHQAQCHFVRKPGTIYHLYERPQGVRYFSMLGPEEWGGTPPHPYLGSYRLENDMSWTDIHASPAPQDEALQRMLRELEQGD